MTDYPKSRHDRQVLRTDRIRRAVAMAEQRAWVMMRSLKCSGEGVFAPKHRADPDGCQNDGSTCLCECHDEG